MAYLIDHPPIRDQWYTTRTRPLTGCTVLHTAEGVLDTIGPDTGAEATAEFIRTRSTPGSYHDLVDSDSWVPLVPYEHGAYHDGTGSNNWALSLSFACRTSDWRAMSPEKRAGFLRNGARAFAAQQAWRKAHGFPLTELRLITKAQSDAGVSGFTYHGLRDPSRRTDPGVSAPDLFPFDEFITYCRAALAGDITEEDYDVSAVEDKLDDLIERVGSAQYMLIPAGGWNGEAGAVIGRIGALQATTAQTLAIVAKASDVDEAELARQLAAELTPILSEQVVAAIVADLAGDEALGLTEAQVQAASERAMRAVLGSLAPVA